MFGKHLRHHNFFTPSSIPRRPPSLEKHFKDKCKTMEKGDEKAGDEFIVAVISESSQLFSFFNAWFCPRDVADAKVREGGRPPPLSTLIYPEEKWAFFTLAPLSNSQKGPHTSQVILLINMGEKSDAKKRSPPAFPQAFLPRLLPGTLRYLITRRRGEKKLGKI